MVVDIISNKKPNQLVSEIFIRGGKVNLSTVFITQTYFPVPKDVLLSCTHFFIMKIPSKQELRQIAINHSSDINSEDLMNFYKKCTAKSYSFLVIHTIPASDNPLRFRENLLERI